MLLVEVKVGRVFLCWQFPVFIPSSSQKLLGHDDSVSPPLVGPCLSLTASVTIPNLLVYLCPLLGWWDWVCLEMMGRMASAYVRCPGTMLQTILCICSGFSCLLHPLSLPWCRNRLLDFPPSPEQRLWVLAFGRTEILLPALLGSWLCHVRCFKQQLPPFQLFQLTWEHFSLCNPRKQSATLTSTSLKGLYPAAGKTISLLCSSFLLPSW